MFVANVVPGQGFQPLTIYEKKSKRMSSGRVATASYQKTDKRIFGVITDASQQEIAEWKQQQHPITHKIVQYSAENKAKATDYLISDTGRNFYIRGINNHGDLNIAVSYFVEERADIAVIKDGEQNE